MNRPRYALGARARRAKSDTAVKSSIPRQGLIPFLNTSLGLWLLSTTFISIGSWAYTTWTRQLDTEKQSSIYIKKLDSEIEHRLDTGDPRRILRARGISSPIEANLTPAFAPLPERVLAKPREGDILFPEFANRTLESLVVELEFFQDKLDFCLSYARQDIEKFRIRWPTFAPKTIEEYKSYIDDLDDIYDRRWSVYAKNARTHQLANLVSTGRVAEDKYLCGISLIEKRREKQKR
nr:hypothetical protein [uncultured Albidiferax sp.]